MGSLGINSNPPSTLRPFLYACARLLFLGYHSSWLYLFDGMDIWDWGWSLSLRQATTHTRMDRFLNPYTPAQHNLCLTVRDILTPIAYLSGGARNVRLMVHRFAFSARVWVLWQDGVIYMQGS